MATRRMLLFFFAVPMVTAALAVVGRFGVNIAYSSGAQYAAELIPTEVRGQGVSAIHMVGYAATFFSSHILYLVSIRRFITSITKDRFEPYPVSLQSSSYDSFLCCLMTLF
jgi:hypothetical protein